MVEEYRNYHGKYFLTIVFASVLLVVLSTSTNQVFAMGDAPSTCTNRYDGPITSFIINNGTQTFDAIANPGVTFNVNSNSAYSVTFVIHTPSTSSQGNSDPGTTWYRSTALGFANGICLPDRTTTSIGPNQNVTVNVSYIHPGNFATQGPQAVEFSTATFSNLITFNVQWIGVPAQPQNLVATALSSSQINLSWTTPSSDGGSAITGYKIYRSTSSGTETFLTSIGNVLSYNDTTVTNEQTYYYMVSAVNSVGESAQSNEASAIPLGPPQPPAGIDAEAVSSSQINVSWFPEYNGGSAITGYKIERLTYGSSTWNTIVSNTGNTSTTYSDTGLAHSTTYYYRVSAINSLGTSLPSQTSYARTWNTVSSSPTNLSATSVSSSQINLSWATPSDNGGLAITGYMIERSTDSGSTWSTIVSNTASTSTTYSDTGLAHSTTYTYRVSAINAAGTSSTSNTASATTFNTVPSPPTGLTASAQVLQINLSWNTPSDNGGTPITGYKIERSTNNGNTWSILVANTGSTGTAYSDTHVLPLTKYTYRVSAINNVGTGNPSNTASASIANTPTLP